MKKTIGIKFGDIPYEILNTNLIKRCYGHNYPFNNDFLLKDALSDVLASDERITHFNFRKMDGSIYLDSFFAVVQNTKNEETKHVFIINTAEDQELVCSTLAKTKKT